MISMKKLPLFDLLHEKYARHGFMFFLVGGSTRDFLLGKEFMDYDFATDALPSDASKFLENIDLTYAKYGVISFKKDDKHIEITTLRKEGKYDDSRHPSSISFISSPLEDSFRRDFTINALYINGSYQVLDFHGGLADLERKIIRFIGNPETRIKEDPLRIARAERLAAYLNFTLEKETALAINKYRYLLKKLNPAKLNEERKKGWKGLL